MQKDVVHNDPLDGVDENRSVGVGIVVKVPLRSAEDFEQE